MRARHPDPVKRCRHCDRIMERKRYGPRRVLEGMACFRRRQFCGRSCFGAFLETACTDPCKSTLHYRARRRTSHITECERCGWPRTNGKPSGTKLETHHRDRNERDNSPGNLEVLCTVCHKVEHGIVTMTAGSF